MRLLKRITHLFAFLALILILLAGCSSKSERSEATVNSNEDSNLSQRSSTLPREEAPRSSELSAVDLKRIESANEFKNQCSHVDTMYTEVQESRSSSGSSTYKTTAHLTLKGSSVSLPLEGLLDKLQSSDGSAQEATFTTLGPSIRFSRRLRTSKSCSRLVYQPLQPGKRCQELFIGVHLDRSDLLILVSDSSQMVWGKRAPDFYKGPASNSDQENATMATSPSQVDVIKGESMRLTNGDNVDLESMGFAGWAQWKTTNLHHPEYDGIIEMNCEVRAGEDGLCGYPEMADPFASDITARFGYLVGDEQVSFRLMEAFDKQEGPCGSSGIRRDAALFDREYSLPIEQ